MQKKNIEVLRKILYAVESGGQVYGRQNYSSFAGVGANCSNEKAITIGAGQWYANEAKLLLQNIQKKYPTEFAKLDTAGIATDLKKSWSIYGVSATSAKGRCIIAIISSAVGIKCQDELMETQIAEYASSIEKTYGAMSDDGMMECINIIHQGGTAALKRIISKTKKPYTAKSIYAALCTDPADKSNNNQVGDYATRQKKVYEFISKYAVLSSNSTTEQKGGTSVDKAIEKLILIAKNEIGYLEKKTNSQLDDKTANAGSANYTKYWRDVYPRYQGQAWCACFVSWCFMKAFGLETAKKLLKHWPYVYCPTLGNLFTRNSNPKVGDIVIFYRGGTFAHTGIVTAVIGDRFYTIEGNTSGASEIVVNGGGVCAKSYLNSQLPGTKFCTPDYNIVNGTNITAGETKTDNNLVTGGKYMFAPETVQLGSKGTSVLLLQEILIARGYKGRNSKPLSLDREAGDNTIYALKAYQKDRNGILEVDGVCGPATWKDLIAI